MNILSYRDVEDYLSCKQVYFRKQISNVDLKTIVESGRVYYVGKVELKRLNENTLSFLLIIEGKEVNIFEYKSDLEMFAFVKTNFIPVQELVNKWLS
jgi:hypothetical protein